MWFGDVAILDGYSRTHDAFAHGPTTVMRVPRGHFKSLLGAYPELYEALVRQHKAPVGMLSTRIEDLVSLPPRAHCSPSAEVGSLVWRTGGRARAWARHRPATAAGGNDAARGEFAPAAQRQA